MGLKASIRKRWVKILGELLHSLGRAWSRFPIVEIWSVHLGHTIFESANLLQHRPLLILWREPMANRWLVKKLSDGARFPSLQKWFYKKTKSTESDLATAAKIKTERFSTQYFLMNLGFNCLPTRLPQISFTQKEINEAEDFLSSNGLAKGKYVCFCVRDESYYKEFKPDLHSGPAKDFEFRNAKLINYVEAANYLKKKGVTPVLMGFSTEKIPDVFLCPATSSEFRPWIEAYLFRECLFTVGMMTGTTLYASLFGRPVLWSDAFWRGAPVGGRKDLVLPKKIIQRSHSNSEKMKDSWVELQMKKWVQLGSPPDNDWSHFAKRGYECKACSSDEILHAVKDMQEFLQTKKMFPNQKARSLHKQFSKLHLRACKKLGHRPTRLSPSWAVANRELLEPKNINYTKYWLQNIDKDNIDMSELIQNRRSRRFFISKKPRSYSKLCRR